MGDRARGNGASSDPPGPESGPPSPFAPLSPLSADDAAIEVAIRTAAERAGFAASHAINCDLGGGVTRRLLLATERASGIEWGFALMPDEVTPGRDLIFGLPTDMTKQGTTTPVVVGRIDWVANEKGKRTN